VKNKEYIFPACKTYLFMTSPLEIKLQEIIESLSGNPSGNPPPVTDDKLKWYLNEIINILNGSGGDSYLGVFIREFNGLVGINVNVDVAGTPPTTPGREGDHWFTLAFNSAVSDGLPAGWIIIPWMYADGAWEFSSLLLPIAAKDLHWVAIKNGNDIEGYYIILSGPNETDLPKWELLGASAILPDKKTIDYNSDGELEVKISLEPVTDAWVKTGRKYAGKDIWWRRFTGNLTYQGGGSSGSIPNYFKDTLFSFANNGSNIHIRNISGEIIPNYSSLKISFPSHYFSLEYEYSMGGYLEPDGKFILNYYSNDIATDVLIAYDICVEAWTENGNMPA
jgi:hypothetical protein